MIADEFERDIRRTLCVEFFYETNQDQRGYDWASAQAAYDVMLDEHGPAALWTACFGCWSTEYVLMAGLRGNIASKELRS